jgi:transcription termination/antitermination protein NusA
MIKIDNFSQVAAQIETERGISKVDIAKAIGQAIVSACRRKFPEEVVLEATLNSDTGVLKIFQKKNIVKKAENKNIEISLKEAKKLDSKAKVDTTLNIEVVPPDFGRIAAQTAKQVIIQRIRDAEKNNIYEEFKDKKGQVIIGSVQKVETNGYLINLGRIEAALRAKDVIPNEQFFTKDRVKVCIIDVIKTPKGPLIYISRTHPDFLKKLLELEVPEIAEGIIEIVAATRDPGKRAKIAVKSNQPAVGAVGTCVGQMGGRIQAVIRELNNEKIDIIEWNEKPTVFIASALKPAVISQVVITNEEEKTAVVVVPNDQLSLAIGKAGINVRLAARLTGWRLDVLNKDEFEEKRSEISGATPLTIVDRIKAEKEAERKQAEESDIKE